MKKIVTTVATAVLSLACLFAVTACNGEKAPVHHSLTPNEAAAFVEKVQSESGAELPMTMTYKCSFTGDNTAYLSESGLGEGLGLAESEYKEYIGYKTFMSDFTGVESVVVSEAMMMGMPYRFVYVSTTEGTDTDALAVSVLAGADLRWNICTSADKAIAVTLDNDFVLIAYDTEGTDALYNEVVKQAASMFTQIGTKHEKLAS